MLSNESSSVWQMYQRGVEYQSNLKLSRKIPLYVKFYEGDQWPAPTEATKNLPRPVFNIVKMICRNKKSAILSVPVKIVYESETPAGDVTKFNRFAAYIQKELGQDLLDKKAIDSGVKKGTYIYHYYWDSEARGKDGIKEGALRCETVDVLSIFFADPTQRDEQKQEWIIIASRESVKAVREMCDKDVDPDTIRADESDDKYNRIEQEGDELVTVLTRYFRKDGEVYVEKATKSVLFKKAFALTPDLEAARRQLGINTDEDAPNLASPDSPEKTPDIEQRRARATLYPIVVGNYDQRENSIYGIGEVEGLIPNQKAINTTFAMLLLNNQTNAWGKYVVSPDALNGQVINDQPGQVLTDYSKAGNGIKKLSEQIMQSQPISVIDSITQLTRVVTGSTEVMTGETIGAGMSGAAIAQLQAQAQMPIEELRDTFWLVKEKQGKVLAQFFKLYYTEKEFTYKSDDQKQTYVDTFNSSDYDGIDYSVVVEATSGTRASAAGDINTLDALLNQGAISVKQYITAYPNDALSNRQELIQMLDDEEGQKVKLLEAELAKAQEQALQLAKIVEEQRKTVDQVSAVISENSRLKGELANMYTEASRKIVEGNRQIQLGNAKLAETTTDAQEFARHIYDTEIRPNEQTPINIPDDEGF